jgi:hypothetical protein
MSTDSSHVLHVICLQEASLTDDWLANTCFKATDRLRQFLGTIPVEEEHPGIGSKANVIADYWLRRAGEY